MFPAHKLIVVTLAHILGPADTAGPFEFADGIVVDYHVGLELNSQPQARGRLPDLRQAELALLILISWNFFHFASMNPLN